MTLQRDDILGGRAVRVTMTAPPGNVFTTSSWRALADAIKACDGAHAILLRSGLDDFSFGASIEEHARPKVGALLASFHEVWTALRDFGLPVATAVRGRCLGGGLELACLTHRVFATPTAELGQPEIRLGVFAPFASVLLPERIGRAAAEDLLLTGCTVDGRKAEAMGLVDAVDDDPEAAAESWIESLVSSSRSSLRHAVAAARHDFEERALQALEAVERRYLGELMRTEDAAEGLGAFLAKRSPEWRHR